MKYILFVSAILLVGCKTTCLPYNPVLAQGHGKIVGVDGYQACFSGKKMFFKKIEEPAKEEIR